MDPSGLTLWRKTRPEFHVRKARVPFVSFVAVHCHPGLCGGGEEGRGGDLRPVCQKGVGIQQPLQQGRADLVSACGGLRGQWAHTCWSVCPRVRQSLLSWLLTWACVSSTG